MDNRAEVRKAHRKFVRSKSPLDALAYLIAAREMIARETPPKNYRQMPHSLDDVPVGGDRKRPAMLNASYPHFDSHLLSISYPLFIQHDVSPKSGMPFEFKKNLMGKEKMYFIDGFNNMTLGDAFLTTLKALGIQIEDRGSTKYGYDSLSQTGYIETHIRSVDYERGYDLIGRIVHGNAASDAVLKSQIEKAMKACSDWKQGRTLTSGFTAALERGKAVAHGLKQAFTLKR